MHSEKWKPDIVVYHGGCDDGFGAAWAIWQVWPDAEFVPATYGKKLEIDTADKNVLMVDFSFKRAELEQMKFKNLVILDHHKTAEAELEPWSGWSIMDLAFDAGAACLEAQRETGHAIAAHFDMNHSGAILAWEFAMVDRSGACQDAPAFLKHIEDRDLWKFEMPNTKDFSAALRTHLQDFELWDVLSQNVNMLITEGAPILRAHHANLNKFEAETYTAMIAGHFVPCCNVPYHYASDMAHVLLAGHPNAPFAAAWFYRGDGKCQFSLRSNDDRLDVSEIARKFGGGGHRNAAGFQIEPVPKPNFIMPPAS